MPLTASIVIATASLSTTASSETGRTVTKMVDSGRNRLYDSCSLGGLSKGVFDKLYSVAERCAEEDWDGYGAIPIGTETFLQAFRFLESLPFGTPSPSVGAEPDGHIAFEWYKSPQRLLSVSVSPDGELHYAALLGPSKTYGTEAFFGEIPKRILDLAKEVLQVY